MALFESRGIDHVGIRYHDLAQALAWFRDTLGLTIDHETNRMSGSAGFSQKQMSS